MSRILCPSCQRPQKACICAFTTHINNDMHVVVLQHPSEVSQTKGTIALLAKSLRSCQVIIGENFSEDESFLQIIKEYEPVLLYPGESAKILSNSGTSPLINLAESSEKSPEPAQLNKAKLVNTDPKITKEPCLVILDGTWKKAYRMYMLSNNIQQLPQVCLPDNIASAGQYQIRKVAKKSALSSLEACCYALALIDSCRDSIEVTPGHAGKYQPLLEKFYQFNQFQLSFRPAPKNLKET